MLSSIMPSSIMPSSIMYDDDDMNKRIVIISSQISGGINNAKFRYQATFTYAVEPHPSIVFGEKTEENYLQHKDKRRKDLYIEEYPNKKDWDDPYTSGFWTRWLLWNEKSLDKSIDSMNKERKTYKHNLKLYIYNGNY